ncbi:hypothetical protein C8Q74DRAFT_407444 [Fomes fomentarius]|nr:hypothetical protein C8Q74DRAFT_407444 [Fomes fomentarius]
MASPTAAAPGVVLPWLLCRAGMVRCLGQCDVIESYLGPGRTLACTPYDSIGPRAVSIGRSSDSYCAFAGAGEITHQIKDDFCDVLNNVLGTRGCARCIRVSAGRVDAREGGRHN